MAVKKINIGILMLFCFIISTSLFAQEVNQYNKKEVGIRMNGLLDFGFIYKKQKTENKYKRLRVASANLSLADFSNLRTTFSLGLATGREKRKTLNDKLKLIRGWEIIEEFNSSMMHNNLVLQFSSGIGIVFGFQYDFNDNFLFNIETIPSIMASMQSVSGNFSFTGVNFGFDTNSIALGVMCKF